MRLLRVNYFYELKQGVRSLYLGITTLSNLKTADLNVLNSEIIDSNYILLFVNGLEYVPGLGVKITNPLLKSRLPKGELKDEYPVLFVQRKDYLPLIIEDALLSIDEFGVLVESNSKISKHSTKIITLSSLREMLYNTFGNNNVSTEYYSSFAISIIQYVLMLQKEFHYLGYLPVERRIQYRKYHLADLSFAWEMYFRYFTEQWSLDKEPKPPNLEKVNKIDGWEGTFFRRDNPIWIEVLNDGGKIRPNKMQKAFIYKKWKEWLGEP